MRSTLLLSCVSTWKSDFQVESPRGSLCGGIRLSTWKSDFQVDVEAQMGLYRVWAVTWKSDFQVFHVLGEQGG